MKPKGAIYDKSDYAGLLRRLIVMIVDFAFVVFVINIAYSVAPRSAFDALFLGLVIFTYLYLIEMKRRMGDIAKSCG